MNKPYYVPAQWDDEAKVWVTSMNMIMKTFCSALIQLNMDEAEIANRRAAWKAPAPRYTRGVLGKYFKLVGTASKGAVTD